MDTRVLAATNVDLTEALRKGQFREDLYYRIGVVVIPMPSLRERDGDILLLAKAFLQRYSAENNKQMRTFTPQALRAIERHSWPGNIRELENRIKRAVIMADGKKVTPADLELTSPLCQVRRSRSEGGAQGSRKGHGPSCPGPKQGKPDPHGLGVGHQPSQPLRFDGQVGG